ncbi:alpha-keto acid decarboxylase family protein [Streptomyces sp. NPDC006923]|uniref:alpha-keto acid decarboxylase family protein n=1 Tax=Streptomyces sp. NPDC006923 TaxID=3155355 RepID=UPI0033FCE9FA
MATCTVGEYLLMRLREIGVRRVFGVAGDYVMEFLDQIEAMEGIDWVGNRNELNAAYAADGYGRLNGISALVTTFGVGELSAINGVAGSFAESVPVVTIVGTPATFVVESRALVHHTLGDGDFTHFSTCMSEFSVVQARLNRDGAASEIDRALRVCWLQKRPVYLMLPSDVAYLPIEPPTEPLLLSEPSSDPRRLMTFTEEAAGRLRAARTAAVLIGHEVDRYHLAPQLMRTAEKIGCPVASLSSGKGIFPEDHDQYIGGYAGKLSEPSVRTTIESADCLITAGVRFTDSTSGGFTQTIDQSRVIEMHPFSASIGHVQYAHVSMKDALSALHAADAPAHSMGDIPSLYQRDVRTGTAYRPEEAAPLVQKRFWQQMQAFLRPGDVLVADQGTSYFGAAELAFPHDCVFVGQPLWGSIGYTLPALLGTMLAAPERRHILVIGDGSFQLTAQELSTILRHRLTPVIILINNDGYTVERTILGATAEYNDIPRWRYSELVDVFTTAPDRAIGISARTEDEFAAALDAAGEHRDRLAFIEVTMDRMDAPENLVKLGKAFANEDYRHAPVS